MIPTEQERSLDIDLDHTGKGEKSRCVARIAVVATCGFTRDGSDATITADCESAAALAREIARLHAELDAALERGSAALGENVRAKPSHRGTAAPPEAKRKRPQLALPYTARDLMTTAVRTVDPNDPVSAAKAAMDEGGFRHLVVVSKEGTIEGVVSHRDLFFGPLAWSMGQGRFAYEKLLDASRVKDVMHRDIVTIDPTTPLSEAAALLREKRIGCLPVVEGEQLTGLLTEGDLVALVAGATA